MFDAKSLLNNLAGSGAAGGFAGALAGSGLAGLLSNKKGRKMVGSAAKLGGMALVGGLAYKAWQSYQAGNQTAGGLGAGPAAGSAAGQGVQEQSAPGLAAPSHEVVGRDAVAPPPSGTAFMPAETDAQGSQTLALLLARSMIAAAKADGQIDTQESQTILNQINGADLPAEEKAFLFEEYGRPLDIQGLADAVESPEHAAEVYAASVLMVEPPSPPEQIYLDSLSGALGLDAGLKTEIEQTVRANIA